MSAQSSGETKSRIAYVDGLRAIAVLSVVVHHAAKYNQGLSAGPLQHALYEGAHGVDLFFIISGFCLSYPVLAAVYARGQATFDVPRYLARRIVRIVPPYYLAIAVIGLGLAVLPRVGWTMPQGVTGSNLTWFEIGKQMIFADRHPEFLNGSFWSLAVEWRWYFLFPLLLVLWTRSRSAFGFVALAAFFGALLTRAGGFDLPILPAFMLGIVAADVEIRNLPIRRLALWLAVLATSLALALEPRQTYEFFQQNQIGWQLAAFFFVAAAGAVGWLRRALSTRPLAAIGIASYSIYLVHEPLIGLMQSNTVAGAPAAALVAIGGGSLFWFLFERPFAAGSLKPRLVKALWPRVARLSAWVGVPAVVRLDARAQPVTIAPEHRPEEAARSEATA